MPKWFFTCLLYAACCCCCCGGGGPMLLPPAIEGAVDLVVPWKLYSLPPKATGAEVFSAVKSPCGFLGANALLLSLPDPLALSVP